MRGMRDLSLRHLCLMPMKVSDSVATPSLSARNCSLRDQEARNLSQKDSSGSYLPEISPPRSRSGVCQQTGLAGPSFPPTWLPCSTTSLPTSTPWPSSPLPWLLLTPSQSLPRHTVKVSTSPSTGTLHLRIPWISLPSCPLSLPPSTTTCTGREPPLVQLIPLRIGPTTLPR